MTLLEIHERINEIRACSEDDGRAHSLEDDLHNDFINFLSGGPDISIDNVVDMARLISTTMPMPFARWTE